MASTTRVEATLAARAIGARTDFSGVAITDLSAEEDRFIQIILSEGVIKPVTGFQVVAGSAATMNVVVGSGNAKEDYLVVPGGAAGQGNYIIRLDDATKTLTLDAADPSNPRIDEVYVVVEDDLYDSSGKATAILAVRKGDAAASPVAPGPDPSWDAYTKLASITIPAAAGDITAATITDSRLQAAINLAGGGGTPTGGMMQFLGSAAPTGWLLADGRAVSRTTYAGLFSVIGTTYGAGDGVTTFNLPDLRQRFPLGKAESGTGATLGETGGAINHTHSGPAHTHSMAHTHSVDPPNTSTNNAGSHSHDVSGLVSTPTITQTVQSGTGINVAGSQHQHNSGSLTTSSGGSHSHSVNIGSFTSGGASTTNTGSAGTGQTGSANPPYIVVNYIIKT